MTATQSMQGRERLGITTHSRYRTVRETQIIEHLALLGWAHRLRAGSRAAIFEEVGGALQRSTDAGLPFEMSPDGERRFDPAEVINWIKWAYLRQGDPFWQDRVIDTGRNLFGEFHAAGAADGGLPPVSELGARRFSVRLRREFNLRRFKAGKQIRLRLPLPLEGPSLRDLEIVHAGSSHPSSRLQRGPGRLDAQLSIDTVDTATLEADLSFVAYPICPGAPAISPADAELYRRPNEGLICIDERIAMLAQDVAGAAQEPWIVVQRCWDFVLDRVICGVVHYDELATVRPLHWVLDSGWCDCRLGSALLIALMRARGLPARMVSGYLLYSVRPVYHYWLEVWIEHKGWCPLDLICSDLSAISDDGGWRNYFLGTTDYRMQTQRLPHLFDGSPSLTFPTLWYALERPLEHGVEIGYYEYGAGTLVYRDQISIRSESC